MILWLKHTDDAVRFADLKPVYLDQLRDCCENRRTVLVDVGGRRFIIPQTVIAETLEVWDSWHNTPPEWKATPPVGVGRIGLDQMRFLYKKS